MTSVMMRVVLCAAAGVSLAACESDFAPDRSRGAATRAVQDPTNIHDPHGETMAGTQEGVPLVSVDFPNKDGQRPTVRTAVDNARDTINPPTPPSATNITTPGEPTRTGTTEIRVNPITGESQ